MTQARPQNPAYYYDFAQKQNENDLDRGYGQATFHQAKKKHNKMIKVEKIFLQH